MIIRLRILLLLLAAPLCAQVSDDVGMPDPFSAGRLFVVAFPDTVGNERDVNVPETRFNDAAVVMIYSPVRNRVTITGGNGIGRWRGELDSGRFTTVDLMLPELRDPFGPISPDPGVQRKNAFRIETDEPVVLYCLLLTAFGAEAWTPLPVEAWGREYYAATVAGDVVRNVYYVNKRIRQNAQPAPSEIVIVAAWDNTQVVIYPNGALTTPPTVISLSANQAYQVRSFVDTLATRTGAQQPDLGGSYIVSTRPIGVISGNTRTAIIDERVGETKNALKNMAVEWLAPADAHGTSMVFMPVFDDLRVTGALGEPLAMKRSGEVVRVFGSGRDSIRGALSSPVEAPRGFLVSRGTFEQIRIDGRQSARQLVATAPVQAMSMPIGVIRPATGAGYDTWGSFMTEMVPREQWTRFAPYIALPYPAGMRHYLNVVSDTMHADDIFVDDRRIRLNMGNIAGTDLVWGTFEVPVAFHHTIEGRNGARFAATMYGLLPGSEKTIGDRYRELLGLSYGYALAPARRALHMRDTVTLDTASDCGGMTVTVRTLTGGAETIRDIRIDSASNVRLAPASALRGPMLTPATLRVSIVDPRVDARGMLMVEDRAGVVHSVAFERAAEQVDLVSAGAIEYPDAMPGDSAVRTVVVRNRSKQPLPVLGVRLASGRTGFRLGDSTPSRTIAPGDTLHLPVWAVPAGATGVRRDTVIVRIGCSETRVPLAVAIVEPCIEIDDLDFGIVAPGALATRTLSVCNRGKGRMRLMELAGDSVMIWSDPSFSVNPIFLDMLRSRTLAAGECIEVEVFFVSTGTGRYETVARVAPDAGACVDSSLWRATVVPLTGVDRAGESGTPELAVDVDAASRALHFRSGLDRRVDARIEIHDAAGRLLARAYEGVIGSGYWELRWDASALPAGVYYCSLATAAGTLVRRVVLY